MMGEVRRQWLCLPSISQKWHVGREQHVASRKQFGCISHAPGSDRAFGPLGLGGAEPRHERIKLGLNSRHALWVDEVTASRLEKGAQQRSSHEQVIERPKRLTEFSVAIGEPH